MDVIRGMDFAVAVMCFCVFNLLIFLFALIWVMKCDADVSCSDACTLDAVMDRVRML